MNATLPAHTHAAFAEIRDMLKRDWAEIERLAANPVNLPGLDMIDDLVIPARLGLFPQWEGWEKANSAREAVDALARPASLSGTAHRPTAKYRRKPDDGATEKLF